MDGLLAKIHSPRDLRGLSLDELERVAGEMREALCRVATTRTAHFATPAELKAAWIDVPEGREIV